MIHTMSGTTALSRRRVIHSPGTGIEHWGTEFFGPRTSHGDAPGPQATMSEMSPNETIIPHFHGTTQFQLFIAGRGAIGARSDVLQPLTVQYKDHHTAYGPVVAGPQGLTFTALRIKTSDSAPVYLDKPGYRDHLKPSKRRNWIAPPVVLSIDPVMASRKEKAWESLYADRETDDGLAAHVLRLGANMATMGPNPKTAGGYYIFVANGTMMKDGLTSGEELPLWSMTVVENSDDGFEIRAGSKGLEAVVMEFPREEG